MEVRCDTCGKEFERVDRLVKEHNFCSNECRRKWFGQYVNEKINLPGHSKGHKATHLTILNEKRNSLCRISDRGKPNSQKSRKIMQKHLERPLNANEVVHHINGNAEDNRLENLALLSQSKHRRMHMQIAMLKLKRQEGGDNDDDAE